MIQHTCISRTLFWASLLLGTGVLLGAIGAHLLSHLISPPHLETYKTGVQYQLIHGLGIFMIGVLECVEHPLPPHKLKWARNLMLIGVGLFSVNCYLYALTSSKIFVVLVPFGGISFIIAWIYLALSFCKKN